MGSKMKNCIKRLRIALFATLFATLFLAAQSASVHAQGWTVTTPFSARVQGEIAIYPGPPYEVVVIGGRVTGPQTITIVFVLQDHWVYPTANPNIYLVKNGLFAWFDAYGNVLLGEYYGYLVRNNAGGYDIHGQFFILGGTGPYTYATGTGQAWGREGGYWDTTYGLFDLFLAGTISL